MYYDLTLEMTPDRIALAQANDRHACQGHLGTHVDVMTKPFPPAYLRLPAVLFDVRAVTDRDIDATDIDLALIDEGMFVGFCTGHEKKYGYGHAAYFPSHPRLSFDLVDHLIAKHTCLVGIDCPGIRHGREHGQIDRHCAAHGLFVVENLTDMETPLDGAPAITCHVNTYPVRFTEQDALLCRLIAEVGPSDET